MYGYDISRYARSNSNSVYLRHKELIFVKTSLNSGSMTLKE